MTMQPRSSATAVVIVSEPRIGLVLARPFMQSGAHVVLITDRETPGHAQGHAEDWPAQPPELRVVNLDDQQAVSTEADQLARQFGSINVWVNVPRRPACDAALEIGADRWDDGPMRALRAVFNGCQAAGREMAGAGEGVIVNVTSALGWHPVAGRCADATLASGIMGLTKALGVEWAPRGVRVVGVATGGNIEAELFPEDRSGISLGSPNRTPLRTTASLDDVADAVFFLASAQASYVVAEILRVDGGWTAYQMF